MTHGTPGSSTGKPRILRICCAEFCRAKGAEKLVEHAERALGLKICETTGDNLFKLQPAFCLGYCGQAPAVMFDKHPYVRASTELLDRLIGAAQSALGEPSVQS